MDRQINSDYIKSLIVNNNYSQICLLLESGLDVNFANGLPLQIATRHGSRLISKYFMEKGANPHLKGDSGVTPLQLAVYSQSDWNIDDWTFLMDCYDSSQLSDAAALAIVQNNIPALKKIMETQRCDLYVTTMLTGKTVEELLAMYKLTYILTSSKDGLAPGEHNHRSIVRNQSPFEHKRNLSPSVAHFFLQATANNDLAFSPNSQLFKVRGSPVCNKSLNCSLSPISPIVRVQK